ncbi:MAG: right-handed parallel beta-helix repeat-containing protein, partial [Candidatus Zipacnadales bacterium]
TLERARDEVRKLKAEGALPTGGVVIELRGGTYGLVAPFELKAEDSGTPEAPIIYQAQPGKQVRLLGGKFVTDWQPVTDRAALSRLDTSARGKVYQADLKSLGLTEYGSPSGGGLELFYNTQPMTLARWPNEGFVKIVEVLSIDPVDVRGTKGDKGGKFIYDGDRPLRWQNEKDLWLHGYWFWDWSDQRMKVESIDTVQKIISLAPPQHGYGYRKGQWYYAFNALSEIDTPGEWYLDRETGRLYFWPPSPLDEGEAFVTIIPHIIKLQGVSHVTLRGLLLEGSRDTAVVIVDGTVAQVVGCTIRNVGGQGVNVSGGTECGVIGCDIYQTAKGGISLNGGDRATLSPAGHYADNNHIHDFARWYRMYNGGIHLNGVGNRATHNLIHEAPHTAIFFGGNDHLIEFNEIHSVCYESNDAGAIYAGRNWTMRGTVIRHNYLHHINGYEGRGCVGVYLDDMFCGTEIVGNLFYRVTNAAFIGGGRDVTIANNIFVECNPSIHVDARAMGWAKYHTDSWVTELNEKRTHLGIPLLDSPYIERYPALTTLTTGDPYAPEGNRIVRNIHWGGRWEGVEAKARPFLTYEDNLIDVDPHFVNVKKLDFRLKSDSPALALGFEPLPIAKMGLYRDLNRASWPIKHTVRPVPSPLPPTPLRSGPPVEYVVSRARSTVTLDGMASEEEWNQAGTTTIMPIAQGIHAEPVKPISRAWLLHDRTALLVGIENIVDASKPLRLGNTWGQDDAVEIAICNPARPPAPILVLRGYPSGHFDSSNEAGAPTEAVEKAAQGVEYQARTVDATRWTAEWRIPFASLGIDPTKHQRLQFNLSVRKTAPEPFWLMWQGTGGCTWEVGNAGVIVLAK